MISMNFKGALNITVYYIKRLKETLFLDLKDNRCYVARRHIEYGLIFLSRLMWSFKRVNLL